ncbi:MAG: sugar phosphate isomerase/epimerase family protein [Victivallales bacterium]|jgi:sugar phosphate isomerase/epimerase
MKTAISGYEFKKDLNGLLTMAEKLKVPYVELWMDRNWNFQKDETDEVKRLLAVHNLRPAGISMLARMNPAENAAQAAEVAEKIIEALEVAVKLGAKFINTYFGANQSRKKEDYIPFYRRHIEPCLRIAKQTGVTILLENEFDPFGRDPAASDVTRTVEGCLELLRAVDSEFLGLTYDPANFAIGGVEPWPYPYEMLKPYIKYIHFKDVTGYCRSLFPDRPQPLIWKDSIVGREYINVALGRGLLNYQGLIRRLKEDAYDGFIVIEPHTEDSELQQTYIDSLSYLKSNGI